MKLKLRLSVLFLITLIVLSLGCVIEPDENNNQTPKNEDDTNQTEFEPPTGNISTEDRENMVQANNKFAIQLYQELSNNSENLFISPWSISSALKITYEGAREKTAEEMRKTLNLPQNRTKIRENYYLNHKEINQIKDYEMIEANAFWYQKTYPFSKNYTSKIENYYNGQIAPLDFIEETEKSKETINNWVSNKTNEKIPELLKTLSPSTRAVITNAIYFKAMWKHPFNSTYTKNETFYTPTKEIQTSTMNANQNIYYTENKEYKAIKLPYEAQNDKKAPSMIIILPKNKENTTKLNQLTLNQIQELKNNLKKSYVEIKLPKFQYKTKYDKEMKQSLKNLGIQKAFTAGANFNGMTNQPNDLFISQVIHNAYINVDENGTEAAAVTAITLIESVPPQKSKFHANHPFTYIIQDHNQNILFIGKLTNPKT